MVFGILGDRQLDNLAMIDENLSQQGNKSEPIERLTGLEDESLSTDCGYFKLL